MRSDRKSEPMAPAIISIAETGALCIFADYYSKA